MYEREVDCFTASSDDGREFTIVAYQGVHEVDSLSGERKTIFGRFRFTTTDGQAVNRKDDDTFEVLAVEGLIIVHKTVS